MGTPLIGYVSDKMGGRRDLVAGLFMAGSAASLAGCVVLSAAGPAVNAALMFITGILIIGPDSILSGTIAQDIGNRSGLGKAAVGATAGFLNSVGSAGSVLQGGVTAMISRQFGWAALFLIFVGCSAASAGILLRVAARSAPTRAKA